MFRFVVFFLAVSAVTFSDVLCKPVEDKDIGELKTLIFEITKVHHLWKRFIDPGLTSGFYSNSGISKIRSIRTRRSPDEDCEKLELCRLHARSSRNPLAAFELYFVNKENARLWDHQNHDPSDCDRRFAHCLGASAQAQPRQTQKQFRENRPSDNYREFRSEDYAQYSDY